MTFKRKVGEKLNLKLALSNGLEDKFVRAYLRDEAGLDLGFQTLTHLANGVYSESTQTMPNKAQVTALFKVFNDAGFLDEACEFPRVLDIFDLDLLDPLQLVPIPAAVFANFESSAIEAKVLEGGAVNVDIENNAAVDAVISQDEIKTLIESDSEIEGVLND